MRRRTYLAATAGAITLTAGCLGGGGSQRPVGDAGQPDPSVSEAGLAPDPEDVSEREIDTTAFDTYEHEGWEIPLVPLEDAYYWYRRREARFVDTRSLEEYNEYHIAGAVHSPAPSGLQDDPIDEWSTDDRIVTYCVCPHTLASMRAADLYEKEYAGVYAIDEGLSPWLENGYPAAGSGVTAGRSLPEAQVITGHVAPSHGGEYAWVRHEPTGQREATRIAPDGSFELHVQFVGITPDAEVTVQTPPRSLSGPLSAFVGEPLSLS